MRKGIKVTALLLGAVLLLGLAACGKKNVQNPQTTAAGSEKYSGNHSSFETAD